MWDKLKDAANAVEHMLNRAPAKNGPAQLAEQATAALGGYLRTLGRDLDRHNVPVGLQSAASFGASRGLEKAGTYLEREGFDGAVHDIGETVKKNPLPFVLAGIGLGILLGRLLQSRRN